MNIRLKDITNAPSDIPHHTTIIHKRPDYISWQCVNIPKHINALEAYIKLTANQPKWLSVLFLIRDAMAKLVGIKAVLGFKELKGGKEKLHFFDVIENEDNKLTLKIEDIHLDVCLCIVIVDNNLSNDFNRLFLTTSVKNKNILGKIYMIPVSVLHPIIAKKLLSNIVRKG